MASNIDTNNELITDVFPFFRVYKDGRVERPCHDYSGSGFFNVPPDPAATGNAILSKDVTISPHVSARLYLPSNTLSSSQKLPVLVYYHGGGLVIGSAFFKFYHDNLNILVSESNAIAISVEYRLAPEHDVTTLYEDCWTALQWVASHASEKLAIDNKDPWLINHGDFSRLSIAGDSAGGNIVYNMAMRAGRNKGIIENVTISGSIFAFPFFVTPIENIEENISYKIWMAITSESECGINSPMINPLAEKAPSLSELGCSRLLLCIAEKDEYIPREIGIQLVDGIRRSGWQGELESIEFKGERHSFHLTNPETQKSQDLIKRFASFIQHK